MTAPGRGRGRTPGIRIRASVGLRRTACPAASLVAGLALLAIAPPAVQGQGFGWRGWAGTTVQAVEMRPVAALADGCVTGEACYLPLAEEVAVAGTQDVSLTAWGFGVQGLSATLHVRGRTGFGSAFAWPRSDDHFDALLGYVQWMRRGWAVRAGRQEIRSGLGFSAFDGGSVGWSSRSYELEAYGGRSLARGLRDPARKALAGLEDFLPDESVYLFGGSARGRFRMVTATARYQRELLADRSGLASERGSLDAAVTLTRLRLTGGLDWDFGRGIPGKGHFSVAAPLSGGRWMLSVSGRRYVPYFSMSTIWGFFEPVAYHEALGRVAWSSGASLGLWVSGGWRKYGDTRATVVLEPLRDTGWRAEAGGSWRVAPAWTVDGSYHLEWGPGGFLNSGDVSLRWSPMERLGVSLSGSSFQQIEQYRLGDGRAWGGGLSVDAEVTRRFSLVAGGSMLRHDRRDDGVESPWNQARAWTSLRFTLGRDAGRANLARMRR